MYSFPSRLLSLLLSITLSFVVLFLPQTLTNTDNSVNHMLLMLLMFGVMLGFIHGVGFKPNTKKYRYLCHPIIGWLLMIAWLAYLVGNRLF